MPHRGGPAGAPARPGPIPAPGAAAGRFLAVEGIDAAGKSSVAADLARVLAAEGESPVLVDRRTVPGLVRGYPARHLAGLAALIWDYPAGARTSELGFAHWSHLLAAWFHAVDELVVRPAVAAGRCVVADSWAAKYTARFALGVGLARAREVFAGVSVPDEVIWLDVPPEVCVGRRRGLRATERGEWQGLDAADDGYLAYQGAVREVYRQLAAAGGWRVLPALDPAALRAELARGLAGRDAPTAERGGRR